MIHTRGIVRPGADGTTGFGHAAPRRPPPNGISEGGGAGRAGGPTAVPGTPGGRARRASGAAPAARGRRGLACGRGRVSVRPSVEGGEWPAADRLAGPYLPRHRPSAPGGYVSPTSGAVVALAAPGGSRRAGSSWPRLKFSP